jgi:hypothetical protein
MAYRVLEERTTTHSRRSAQASFHLSAFTFHLPLLRIPVLEHLGDLLLGRKIALARRVHHDRDTGRLTAWSRAKLESDPAFYIV